MFLNSTTKLRINFCEMKCTFSYFFIQLIPIEITLKFVERFFHKRERKYENKGRNAEIKSKKRLDRDNNRLFTEKIFIQNVQTK